MVRHLHKLFLLVALTAKSNLVDGFHAQQPFSQPTSGSSTYNLQWPVRKVAIIGAGPSGLIAYREFTREGFEVRLFERDHIAGGNWHYTEETPVDAPIPNADIAVGDYVPSLPPSNVSLPYEEEYNDINAYYEQRRKHRGPKPLWESLKSNAPAPVQSIRELPWPIGTPWELPHYKLRNYIRAFASYHGINSNDGNPDVSYNTRVEVVEPRSDATGRQIGWLLTLKQLVRANDTQYKATWWTEEFDAVVVATGRFNAPNIPAIPGLIEWGKRFPERISHSRQYRRPQPYTNETILIVGAATSGGEISRDLNPYARKIYQSIRPDNTTVPHFELSRFLYRLPANTTIVPEIKRFLPVASNSDISAGSIELVNGTIITGIDRIIFATGFRYSFPFLPQYHNASIRHNETAPAGTPQPLVTDGTHIRSLHLDLFYIEQPTIGFLDMNLGMQSFTYAEYLSVALARVWGDKAKLPSTEELWRLYDERVEDRGGYGRHFQFLGKARMDANIRYIIGWINDAAVKYGGRQLDGLEVGTDDIVALWAASRFGGSLASGYDSKFVSAFGRSASDVHPGLSTQREKEEVYDSVFNDYW